MRKSKKKVEFTVKFKDYKETILNAVNAFKEYNTYGDVFTIMDVTYRIKHGDRESWLHLTNVNIPKDSLKVRLGLTSIVYGDYLSNEVLIPNSIPANSKRVNLKINELLDNMLKSDKFKQSFDWEDSK